MSMTVSRLGQVNLTGDERALFLTKFSGEVLAAFRQQTKFLSRHRVKSVSGTNAVQFPAIGRTSAGYHTPGAQITGSAIAHAQRTIEIDDLLYSDAFIYKLDAAMNHYDARSEYTYQCGAALAQTFDRHVAQVGLLAARDSATITGMSGGTVLENANAATDADALVDTLFEAAAALDQKDVPEEDRYVFLAPDQYYMLVNSSSKAIHRDYGNEGNGSIAGGFILRVANFEIVKTNNLPSGKNIATGPSKYQGDFTNTVALAMHKSAVGTAKLIDVGVEMEYKVDYQGTLIVATLAVGTDILRPEAAVEITTDDGV